MAVIRNHEEWVRYMRSLNEKGVGGTFYEFQHIESPEQYPCVVASILDDHPPAGANLAMVHCFFYEDDARVLLGQNIVTFNEEEPGS